MLVAREIELRMPDSGARDAAEQLRAKFPLAYDAVLRRAGAAWPTPLVAGGVRCRTYRAAREERLKLVAELEKDTSASAMKAYFFIAPVLQLRDFRELKPTVDARPRRASATICR